MAATPASKKGLPLDGAQALSLAAGRPKAGFAYLGTKSWIAATIRAIRAYKRYGLRGYSATN